MGQQPILEVGGAEVVDAAEGAGIDEEAQLADGGDEAVVVGGHVFDAGGAGGFEHGQGFGGAAGERFFAEEVDAGLGGGDAGFGVDVVGAAVIEGAGFRRRRAYRANRYRCCGRRTGGRRL